MELGIREQIGAGLRQFEIKEPTDMQKLSIPRILHLGSENNENNDNNTKKRQKQTRTNNGENIILASETGSGKTLAYLVPLLNYLIKKEQKINRKDGCYLLILTPTRELAI